MKRNAILIVLFFPFFLCSMDKPLHIPHITLTPSPRTKRMSVSDAPKMKRRPSIDTVREKDQAVRALLAMEVSAKDYSVFKKSFDEK